MADVERKLAAILSADAVGYSRLMAEDEDATVRTLTDYREEIGMLVRQHRGRVADFTGDNFLAEFPTATDAVQCAVEIQGVLKVRNAPLPAERKMEFRIGVHLGEVRVEGDRISTRGAWGTGSGGISTRCTRTGWGMFFTSCSPRSVQTRSSLLST